MNECDILFYYHKYTVLIFIIRKYLNNFHFIHNLNSSLFSFKTKEQFQKRRVCQKSASSRVGWS